ncbi:uncharacterized protein C9orf85 homolog isoform X1 [Narcine bancroftii]|uniref:uncharacterized protein C9orf85 homolog isoform X1 n=1 Tax=Narcine bancroftii TaxID=1343680 RepID=UPI00383201ED
MSTERGNVARRRGQKYQNVTVFKNDKYDKSNKMKMLNAIMHTGVCKRCKEVLEWKIKYSKYKTLSQPRKCVKCLQKTVKDSYHVLCKVCAFKLELCAKCGKKEEIVHPLTSDPQSKQGDAETNPHTRSCVKRSEGDEYGDDSDFNNDGGRGVQDGAKSIETSLTHLSTQQTDAPLLKSNQIVAQREMDFSSLNLED